MNRVKDIRKELCLEEEIPKDRRNFLIKLLCRIIRREKRKYKKIKEKRNR